MKLGRVFRKLGLPFWTFAGIGVSGLWFSSFGLLVEKGMRDWLRLNEKSPLWKTYLPTLLVFALPLVAVGLVWLWHKARYGTAAGVWRGGGLAQPEGKKGLILLVSNPASAMFAIGYHFRDKQALERVWLIPSNDARNAEFGTGSRPQAEQIKQEAATLAESAGRPLAVTIHDTGVSPAEAQDTYDYVNRIYRQSGYEPDEIIADFTGGTKPMSVGMIMACLPAQRELEYVSFNPAAKTSHGPYLIDYQHRAFDLMG